ncbi:MAG: MgtC/SapB family protein [Longimicrobiales bacterium]
MPPLPDLISEAGGFIGRLALAAALGGAIGVDRERSGKPAGFRTNMLICVGAALLTELSLRVAASSRGADGGIQADPARIAAQIVSGIGFLGAGTILQSRGSVIGLTTAATLWVVAAIGMAVGAGQYTMAVAGTVLVIIALILLPPLERWMAPDPPGDRTIEVMLGEDAAAIGQIQELLNDCGLAVESFDVQRRENALAVRYYTHGTEREVGATLRVLLEHGSVQRVSVT